MVIQTALLDKQGNSVYVVLVETIVPKVNREIAPQPVPHVTNSEEDMSLFHLASSFFSFDSLGVGNVHYTEKHGDPLFCGH